MTAARALLTGRVLAGRRGARPEPRLIAALDVDDTE